MAKNHEFWNKQPVDKSGEGVVHGASPGPLEQPRLPDGFRFEDLDSIGELDEFLRKNYSGDASEGHMLRYSEEFLRWMLEADNGKKRYCIVLRLCGRMVGFVFGREHIVDIRGERSRVLGANFLCVSQEMRGRGLAPVLIREVTRRANVDGIFRGVFTSEARLFFNVSRGRYYHRPLNPQKLFESGFCDRIMEVKDTRVREGTRLTSEMDMASIAKIYLEESRKYMFHEEMELADVVSALKPVKGVVYTYVHENQGTIDGFGTFFVIDTVERKSGKAARGAYLYYRGGSDPTRMVEDLMYFAQMEGCDVFNTLDIMGNTLFLAGLGFVCGSGELKYYLYNWGSEEVPRENVFFVLP